MLKFGLFPLFILYWWCSIICGVHANSFIEKREEELKSRTLERILPVSSLRSRRLFEERYPDERNAESDFTHEISYGNPGRENFILQQRHLRYLMSSTAEQPDNSSRSSAFNIWLTILIAALAAAILS